jgi:hypothetical protein
MTEETDWIGGQFTAQAVPPDEHPWIETTGCTASYRRFAQGVRDYYRRNYPLTMDARADALLNPGGGNVSRLCHEPRVALAVMQEMLAPYLADRRVEILLRRVPVGAEMQGDRIVSVSFRNEDTGEISVVQAPYVIDATELGDLLELANVEHVIGSESQAQTGELHALPGDPQPLDQQAISWCFALDCIPGTDNTIPKPDDYEFWKSYQADFWPGPLLGWHIVDPVTLKPRYQAIFDYDPEEAYEDFWHFRRILQRDLYLDGHFASDISMVNWPHIDYWLGPLIGVAESKQIQHRRAAMQLSFSFLHWMQTEAPRPDGGVGYPELRLRHDVVDTAHGLTKSVYVREARRIVARMTVLEEHVGVEQRGSLVGAQLFHDTVGVGSYRIDLHPSTGQRSFVDISSYPFQIPLGALLPVRVENLLPAAKNIGTTHITNGCYRLHPVEWNIGEAVGAVAAFCLNRDSSPAQIHETPTLLAEFQQLLVDKLGFVLNWPEYARVTPR